MQGSSLTSNQQMLTDLQVRATGDFIFFCENIVPELFKNQPLSKFHRELALLPLTHRWLGIIIPVGHLKTTIFSKAYALWRLSRESGIEVCLVSSSIQQSMKILKEIQELFETNEFLKRYVPTDRDVSWNRTNLATTNHNKLYVKPFNSSVRGIHPDYLIFDDLLRETEMSMDKVKDIFWGPFFTRGMTDKARIIVVGTPQTADDLYAELEERMQQKKGWHVVRLPAVITNAQGTWLEPLWRERYSLEELRNIMDNMGEYRFKREYLCNPLASGASLYPAELVANCCDSKFLFSYQTGGTSYIGCDFAMSIASTGDYNVFTVVDCVEGLLKRKITVGGVEHDVVVKNPIIVKNITRYRGASGHAERVKMLYDAYHPAKVICDISTFGAKIVQEIREFGIPTEAQDFQRTSRNELLVNLRRLMETDDPINNPPRLLIPTSQSDQTFNLTRDLILELQGFEQAKSDAGITTFKTSLSHDDTVMSLAMAVKNAGSRRGMMMDFIKTSDDLQPRSREANEPIREQREHFTIET